MNARSDRKSGVDAPLQASCWFADWLAGWKSLSLRHLSRIESPATRTSLGSLACATSARLSKVDRLRPKCQKYSFQLAKRFHATRCKTNRRKAKQNTQASCGRARHLLARLSSASAWIPPTASQPASQPTG